MGIAGACTGLSAARQAGKPADIIEMVVKITESLVSALTTHLRQHTQYRPTVILQAVAVQRSFYPVSATLIFHIQLQGQKETKCLGQAYAAEGAFAFV